MQPLIRACMLGFAFLNTQDTGIAEGWVARTPNTAPCPFHVLSPVSNFRSSEFTRVNNGRVECQWIVATSDVLPLNVYISVDANTTIYRLQATTFSPFVQTNAYNAVFNPCDIDLSGSSNVVDFIQFMNNPYDFNMDGSFNVLDYISIINNCR